MSNRIPLTICWISRLPDEVEAGKLPAACVVLNQNAKGNEGKIMNYLSCNIRVKSTVWHNSKKKNLKKGRLYIKQREIQHKLRACDPQELIEPTFRTTILLFELPIFLEKKKFEREFNYFFWNLSSVRSDRVLHEQ